MTDKPMTMRDRLALAAAIAMDLPDHKGYEAVDAMLAEAEKVSDAVIQAGEDDGGHSVYRWAAMVKAIRGGA